MEIEKKRGCVLPKKLEDGLSRWGWNVPDVAPVLLPFLMNHLVLKLKSAVKQAGGLTLLLQQFLYIRLGRQQHLRVSVALGNSGGGRRRLLLAR